MPAARSMRSCRCRWIVMFKISTPSRPPHSRRCSRIPQSIALCCLRHLGARTRPGRDESAVEFQAAAAEAVWGPHFVYWIPAPRGSLAEDASQESRYVSAIGENLLALHGRGIPHALAQQFVELNTYNREFERLNGKQAFDRLDS